MRPCGKTTMVMPTLHHEDAASGGFFNSDLGQILTLVRRVSSACSDDLRLPNTMASLNFNHLNRLSLSAVKALSIAISCSHSLKDLTITGLCLRTLLSMN